MIAFRDVSLMYRDGTTALRQVDLDIKKGELVVITGASGSGKTSLLRLMTGLQRPTSGEVRVFGEAPRYRMRLRIGQTFDLIASQSVRENIRLPLRFTNNRKELSALYGKKRDQEIVEVMAEEVGIFHLLDKTVEEISSGEYQRAAIARALITCPDIVIADEPTASLDEYHARRIFTLLRSYSEKHPEKTVIVTTHNLERVAGQYRHLVMDGGRLRREDGKGMMEKE